MGSESADKAASFGSQIDTLAERTRQADQLIADATDRLAVRLAEIERAGTDATGRVTEAEGSFSGVLDALLDRTSVSLQEIRSGIDAQAAAVAALVDQASAGIGKAAADSAEALGANIGRAGDSLGAVDPGRGTGTRIAADDRRD